MKLHKENKINLEFLKILKKNEIGGFLTSCHTRQSSIWVILIKISQQMLLHVTIDKTQSIKMLILVLDRKIRKINIISIVWTGQKKM